MRILQILPELNVGGVERGAVDFGKYLISHGHQAVVVSNGGALIEELKDAGVTHYHLPVHKKSFFTAWQCIRALRRIIRKEAIEIVHARSRVPAWIAYFACRGTTAQFITTCHGYYSKHFFSQIMGWAKFVIVPSEVIGRHMIVNFGVPAENIRCIARSVDLNRFKETPSEAQGKSTYVIAIVGRITPLKGHIYFLRAMAKVVRSMPFVKIWIIGDAPPEKEAYKHELQVLVQHLGLSEVVQFMGNRKDVPELLSQVDVLAFASTVPESFGRVILEAQAAGVPVVATKVGGVVDIIDDEKTGLLVLPKDPDGMASAVLRLLTDRKLARELTAAARKKLDQHFTLEHMASHTLKVYQELLASLNILMIKISSLGDVILIIPSLRALRKKFPQAKIYCLVGKESRQLLQRCPYLDEIIVVDMHDQHKGWFKLFKFGRRLAHYQFDKIIDFQNNRKSHFLAAVCFPRESYGYKNGKWGFLISHPVKKPRHDLPPVQHQFQILAMLGIAFNEEDNSLELWPSENDHRMIQELLDAEWLGKTRNIVGVNLAASAKWQTKNWPLEYIARLCDLLAAKNIRVIVTGMEKDKNVVDRLMNLTKAKPANFVGKTNLLELAVLIQRCRLFITPDSAPLHIAAAMKTPFIAFFGPTDSSRHLPPAKSGFVFERKPNCAPCYSPRCRIGTHICMKNITPEEVFEEVKKMVNNHK